VKEALPLDICRRITRSLVFPKIKPIYADVFCLSKENATERFLVRLLFESKVWINKSMPPNSDLIEASPTKPKNMNLKY